MVSRFVIAATAAAAAVVLGGVASANPDSSTQRIALQSQNSLGSFVLTPLTSGPLKRDQGSVAWGTPSQRFVMRGGQRVEVNDLSATILGARGSLLARFRIEWTDAGHDYFVGHGRWTILRGTGAYKGLTGGGRGSSVWPPGGDVRWRDEGVVNLP